MVGNNFNSSRLFRYRFNFTGVKSLWEQNRIPLTSFEGIIGRSGTFKGVLLLEGVSGVPISCGEGVFAFEGILTGARFVHTLVG